MLTGSKGTGLKLSGAKLKDAQATGVSWPRVDLVQAHLSKADLTDADLTGGDLTEAAGAEVVLVRAKLDGVRASRARLPAANLGGASLVGAKLDGANLTDADLTGANLTDADLAGANLTNAKLAGATLRGASFAEAGLEGVDFTGLDLEDVDLTGADPTLIGLTAAQRKQLRAAGVPVNPDAVLRPAKVSAARNGGLVVAVWENDDGEEQSTVRWAVCRKKKVTHGILPVTSGSLLSRSAVAVGDGVDLVLLRERPTGIAVERFHVDAEGRVGPAVTSALQYQPQIVPILRAEGTTFRMWGLARRGPTLVVSADGPEGFAPVATKAMATALGFLGKHHPLLVCKGGVVVPCSSTGPGSPLKRPDGFPAKLCSSASNEDGWFAVWVEPPEGRNKGGLRGAWLGTRQTPVPEPITDMGAVLTLDAVEHQGRVWIAWAELHGVGETRAFVRPVTEHWEEPAIALPVDDVDEVTFAPGPGDGLVLALTTDEERTVFVDHEGTVLGVLQEG